MNNQIIAVYPGTFDPITNGHLDIIKRACPIFSQVVIAIAKDTNKNTLFSAEERLTMIQEEIVSQNIQNAKVATFKGLLVKFLESIDARIIIRGLRAVSDFEYEFQLSFINHTQKPDVETIFLPATQGAHFISSSFVKEIARLGGDLKDLVSKNIAINLEKKYNYQKIYD